MGGSNGSALKNTEFVYANGQTASGPTLDFTIKDHCMVKLSDNKIFIIGGEQNGAVSNQVWIVDPTKNFQISFGQPLRKSRKFFSCATFEDDDGQSKIIIAGGRNPSESSMDSVEILNTSVPNSQWIDGKTWYNYLFFNSYRGTNKCTKVARSS